MKKFLLSLATVAMALSASATSVTFDFTSDNYGLPEYEGNSTLYAPQDAVITSGLVSITLSYIPQDGQTAGGWRYWNDGLRVYPKRNPSFTVTVDGYNVTGVEINASTSVSFAVAGTTENVTSWAGDEAAVSFTYTGGDSTGTVTSFTVYYNEVFTPGEEEVYEFTVSEALEALSEIASGETFGNAIVSGIISEVGTLSSGALTYYIKDSLDDENALQVYRGLGIDRAQFTTASDLVVGARVQVYGTLKNYYNETTEVTTPELDQGNYLLTYDDSGVEVPSGPEGIITVAYALQLIEEENYEGPATVTGYITNIEEVEISYGNATYTISDDLQGSNALYVYRGRFTNGDKFTSQDQLAVGAKVVVNGNLTNYEKDGVYTPEFTSGSTIIEYIAPEAGIAGIEADAAEAIFFNLQGIRVANPIKGQIYIVNGKKVVF